MQHMYIAWKGNWAFNEACCDLRVFDCIIRVGSVHGSGKDSVAQPDDSVTVDWMSQILIPVFSSVTIRRGLWRVEALILRVPMLSALYSIV